MRSGAGRAAALALLSILGTSCAAPARSARPSAPVVEEIGTGAARPSTPRRREQKQGLAPEARGVVHVVKKGETAWRIARTYDLTADELLRANEIDDARALKVGTALLIPGAREPRRVPRPGEPFPAPPAPAPEAPAPVPATASAAPPIPAAPAKPETASIASRRGTLGWPLQGVLYSRYGPRNGNRHDGIDVSAPHGSTIRAAADGDVIFAGEQSGYGSIVIVRHAGGLVTVYAHASALLVREGAEVRRGDPIARVGQTGRTSGPHLHFEVREGTRPRDPLLFLP